MKKLVLALALTMAAAWPAAAATTGALKLSLWNEIAIATPDNIHEIEGVDFGIGSSADAVTGLQWDLVFSETKYELTGASFAWVINLANNVRGAQFALLTKAEQVQGAQLGFLNMAQSSITGVQFGLLNQAEYVHGVQLGFVNYTKTIYGLQIGLLNIAENGWLPTMIFVNGRF